MDGYDDHDEEMAALQKRMKELEEETAALREMQAKADQKDAGAAERDGRSIFVGNVDYGCTPEEVQQHFESCGDVNRVTIWTDKLGQPKGFAYVEFSDQQGAEKALELDESVLYGRQIKVMAKRTNVPGMKQFRGRCGGGPRGGRGSFYAFMDTGGRRVITELKKVDEDVVFWLLCFRALYSGV